MPLNHGLIDSVDISLANLPDVLEGLRIAHVSDPHLRRVRPSHQRMIRQLARMRLDMIVLTGDILADPGYEAAGVQFLEELCAQVKAEAGIFAVGGNHDSRELCRRCAHLRVRWLNNEISFVKDRPLEMFGFEHTHMHEPDPVATLLHIGERRAATEQPSSTNGLRFAMSHCANMLPAASELGAHLMFAGHTHGGQIRIPPGWPVINSTDLPLALTSGILRHRNTLCLVSRGLGYNGLPLRLFCPPHIPIYTLHRGPTPGQYTDQIENIRPW